MAKHQFSSPQYPQLIIAGVEGDKDGKGAKPSAAFLDGQLYTEDADVAARVKEAMEHDPSLGIVAGAGPSTETPAGADPWVAPAASAPPMKSMNKAELQATAEGMGIDSGGTNAELIERIEAAKAGKGGASSGNEKPDAAGEVEPKGANDGTAQAREDDPGDPPPDAKPTD